LLTAPIPSKGQEALVAQIGLEHAAVVSAAAGDDHVARAEIIDEANVVLRGVAGIDAVRQQG
jgi:hypothetical protein